MATSRIDSFAPAYMEEALAFVPGDRPVVVYLLGRR